MTTDIAAGVLHNLHMFVTFGLIVIAMFLYAMEKLPMEITSIMILCFLLMFFHFFPMQAGGGGYFSPAEFLQGFANPALIAVLGLLVMGQAIVNTGSLNALSGYIAKFAGKNKFLAIFMTLSGVALISAFVNNTPATVVFIPIMIAIASQINLSPSKVMMPLSYASILGGTTVLIGSSTNLLVDAVSTNMGIQPMGLFDFTLPGVIIAAVGMAYILFIMPRLLVDRAPLSSELMGDAGRQFVVQLEIDYSSELVGKSVADDNILDIDDVAIKMVQRAEHAYLAPFSSDLTIRPNDVILLAATKQALINLLSKNEDNSLGRMASLNAEEEIIAGKKADNLVVSEVLVAHTSRMIGKNIEQIGFYYNTHCTILGIQRRSRMITSRMTEIRLAAGDVLLVMGTREDIEKLRENPDLMLMEWSTQDLPSKKYSRRVNIIFASVILSATLFDVPIYIGAFVGSLAVILAGCLNSRQAAHALDGQIILLVAAGLALGTALQVTGGATFLADSLVGSMGDVNPVWVMSAMFLLMALCTNVLSNNATALIFTPIAITTAERLNVDPHMFIYAVIFASNCCSFASPIGFQTNLLVMGPGHYKFADYLKAGIPLSILVWVTYTVFSYYYF